MIKEIIASGKDINEAKENARAALGVGELDDVQFEVLHLGSRGIFGIIGVKPAQVRAFIELPEREERRQRGERRKPRQERPAAPKAETATEETAETAETPAEPHHKKKRRHKKKNHSEENRTAAPKKAPEEVIPEVELKMERREVEEGEDMSYDFIRTVILDIGLDATAELYSCEDGSRRIAIKGEEAHTLIGHHGDTLDALQYLANLASARKNKNGERDKSRVTLDIEGYRAKREATLRALARRMAQKALRNRRSVMLEPMSAYERRIIHSEVQGIEGVSTNSIGSDNNRKIVIYLTDKKPEGIFDEDREEKVAETVVALTAATHDDDEHDTGSIEMSSLADCVGEHVNEVVSIETSVHEESEDEASSDGNE